MKTHLILIKSYYIIGSITVAVLILNIITLFMYE